MFGDSFKVLEQAFTGRTVIIRVTVRQPTTPLSLKRLVRLIASAVALAPVPAITGIRPSASSSVIITTSPCSSWLSVADSPVVPTETIAEVPLATW